MPGSKKAMFENDFLKHYFQNANIPLVGDSTGLRGSATPGNAFIALLKVSPTNNTPGTECGYTGYTRVAVVRSASGFTVVDNEVYNAAIVAFGECSANPEVALSFAICRGNVVGVDDQDYWADLSAPYDIPIGKVPSFGIGDMKVTEN